MSFSVVTNISSLSAQAQLDKTTQLQIAPLEEAIKLLTILLAGWEEAAKKEDLAVPNDFARRARCQHRAIPIARVAAGRKKWIPHKY